MIDNCDSNSQERLRPNQFVKQGNGRRSTKGAQMNLNEYPSRAQLKNVLVDLSTPASFSHIDKVP